jgi:hypothetical protein
MVLLLTKLILAPTTWNNNSRFIQTCRNKQLSRMLQIPPFLEEVEERGHQVLMEASEYIKL